MNEVNFYTLPSIIDAENHKIFIIPTTVPYFVTIDGKVIAFKPDSVENLGTWILLFAMTDNVVAGQKTEFKFKLTVLNDPPEFKGRLIDQRFRVGSIVTYSLPNIEDREKLMYNVTAKWMNGELPDFISFNGVSMVMQPRLESEAGVYRVDLELTDGYSLPKKYFFMVTVEKNPPKPKVIAQRANVKIVRIGRDGQMEIKITAVNNLANLTNIISN